MAAFDLVGSGLPVINRADFSPLNDWESYDLALNAWLTQSGIHNFASVAARNAGLGGLTSTDTAWAYTRADKTLWGWTGSTWDAVWTKGSAWKPYTLVMYLVVDGVAQPLSFGDGTKFGFYQVNGNTVHVRFYAQFGASTSPGSAAGTDYQFSGPFTAAHHAQFGVGNVRAPSDAPCTIVFPSTTRMAMVRNKDETRIGRNSFAWAAGHTLSGSVTYERAAS